MFGGRDLPKMTGLVPKMPEDLNAIKSTKLIKFRLSDDFDSNAAQRLNGRNRFVSFVLAIRKFMDTTGEPASRKQIAEATQKYDILPKIVYQWFGYVSVDKDIKLHSTRKVYSKEVVYTIDNSIFEILKLSEAELRDRSYRTSLEVRRTNLKIEKLREESLLPVRALKNEFPVQVLDVNAPIRLYMSRFHTFYLYTVMPPDPKVKSKGLASEWPIGASINGRPITEILRVSAENTSSAGIAVLSDLRVVWVLDTAFKNHAESIIKCLTQDEQKECRSGNIELLQRYIKNDFVVNLGELCDALNESHRYADYVMETIYRLRTTHYVADFSKATVTKTTLNMDSTIIDYQLLTSLRLELSDDIIKSKLRNAKNEEPSPKNREVDNQKIYLDQVHRHGAKNIFLRLSFNDYKYTELLVDIGRSYRIFSVAPDYRDIKDPLQTILLIIARLHVSVSGTSNRTSYAIPADLLFREKASQWASYSSFKRALFNHYFNEIKDPSNPEHKTTSLTKIQILLAKEKTIESKFGGFVFTLVTDPDVIAELELEGGYDARRTKPVNGYNPILTIVRDKSDKYIGNQSVHNRLVAKEVIGAIDATIEGIE